MCSLHPRRKTTVQTSKHLLSDVQWSLCYPLSLKICKSDTQHPYGLQEHPVSNMQLRNQKHTYSEDYRAGRNTYRWSKTYYILMDPCTRWHYRKWGWASSKTDNKQEYWHKQCGSLTSSKNLQKHTIRTIKESWNKKMANIKTDYHPQSPQE